MRTLIALVLMLSACAPVARPLPSPQPTSPTPALTTGATATPSPTPGVKRTFVLESLRVESVYRKPWGTLALADARVTIADHAVDGSSPDQRETGLLRLGGDDRRLSVSDSWDDAAGRWFNGRIAEDPAGLRQAIAQPIGWYLRTAA